MNTLTLGALMRQEAHALIAHGFRVFPCAGKIPTTPRGFLDAKGHDAPLDEWWPESSSRNIGIALGPWGPDGKVLFAIDVDPRNGGAVGWAHFLAGRPLPDTVTAASGRGDGGCHFYLCAPPGWRHWPKTLGPGVDVKQAGYVIAPPSLHPDTGEAYRWELDPWTTPIADAPDWLLRDLERRRSRPSPSGTVRLTADVEAPDFFVTGERNQTLTSLAGTIRRRGMTGAEILPTLLAVNAARCRPPLDELEVGRIADSAGRNMDAEDPLVPGQVAPKVIRWVDTSRLLEPLPPISWICKGMLIAPGAVSALSGYGYSGKTALAISLQLSVASGRPFLGLMACEQGDVGYLDYEQGFRLSVERMQRLARGMGLELGEVMPHVCYCPFPEIYVDDVAGRDHIAIAVEGKKLVVIDSSRASMPGVEENDSKSRIHVDGLSRISEKTGTAFLLICHDGKGGDTPKSKKERTRGSSAMYDAMQTVWGVEARDGEDFSRAEIRKDRLTGSRNAFGYRFEDSPHDRGDPASWLKIHHLDPEQMRGVDRATLYGLNILQVMRANPGLTSIDMVRLHMPPGYRHTQDVRAAVRDLEAKGQVVYTSSTGYRAT